MYDPFKDYTEVNPSKRDKPGFLGRVKKFLYDPEVEGEAMKELFKKATDYLSPSSFRATEYSEENPSLNESSRSYSKKLKNLGKWLWRNKWKIVVGGLIAGGLTFLNRITYTVRPAGGIPELVRPGIDGMVTKTFEPEELAGLIIELLENDVKREAFGKAGRKRVEQSFAASKIVPMYEQVFQSVLS